MLNSFQESMVCKDGCFRVSVENYLTLECVKSLGEVFHLITHAIPFAVLSSGSLKCPP